MVKNISADIQSENICLKCQQNLSGKVHHSDQTD